MNKCDCSASGNLDKPKQHGADPHAKNCAIYLEDLPYLGGGRIKVKLMPAKGGGALVVVPNDLPGLPAWFKTDAAYRVRVVDVGLGGSVIVVEQADEDNDDPDDK